MSSFEAGWLQQQTIDLKLADCLREIGEHKGRAELYGVHTLHIIESLRLMTAEHSAAASSRMESIQNPAEQANYFRLILSLQEKATRMPVEPETILTIHSELFRDSGRSGGAYKTIDNQVVATRPDGTRFVSFHPVTARNTQVSVEQLCRRYLQEEAGTEPLLLIGAFVLDFLCIRPFTEGNGRMAQLIALLLMNRQGYNVSRFVSVERVMEEKKSDFFYALYHSSQDWHQSRHDIGFWWSYWVSVLLISYRDFTQRARALSKRRGVKTDMVLSLLESMQEGFTIRQIQQRVPGCGIELIRKIFKAEKAAGRIKCLGRGPNALWQKKKIRAAVKTKNMDAL
jgi:Fic family protein